MSAIANPTFRPVRMFELTEDSTRVLDDILCSALTHPEDEQCPVCSGDLERVLGGVACTACGSELVIAVDASGTWSGESADAAATAM